MHDVVYRSLYFAEQEVLAIFVQLALAVHYVHAQGILHRDLKAANVFLAPGGVAKLGDFGIARVLTSGQEGEVGRCKGSVFIINPEP
jgi:serine/threonine protein kinase